MKITRTRITIGVCLIVILWAISGYLTHRYSYEDRGTFGDMFGAINALFSGLALFGIIVSILIQQNELTLQRKELSDTRKVLNLQNETLNFQRFENTFFNLVTLHHKLVNELNLPEPTSFKVKSSFTLAEGDYIKGFPAEYVTIMGSGKNFLKEIHSNYRKFVKGRKKEEYKDFFKIIQSHGYSGLEQYYRNLYGIFEFIDGSKINNGELENLYSKKKYLKILLNQLSDFEIMMLQNYNNESQNFLELMKKYKLDV